MSGGHTVNISFFSFTGRSAKLVQFQGITALETMGTHLPLPPGEAADIPGTHAASLAAYSPLKWRPNPKETQMNPRGEFTKRESSKVKTC